MLKTYDDADRDTCPALSFGKLHTEGIMIAA